MKKNLIYFLFAITFCFLTLPNAFGCAVITVPSLTKFDSSEYVFIGKIKGVANPLESTKFHEQAWGLKVEVEQTIYLPDSPTEYFEVFPFDLESDCKDRGWSKEKLLTYFPLGSNVKVIAKESKYSPSKQANGNIRLEILPDNLGNISRNYLEDGKAITSAKSVYNYQSYVAQNSCGLTESEYPFYEAQSNTPDFELRKDFLRLHNATTEEERVNILKRLIYLPDTSDDFLEMVHHYLKNRRIISQLTKERKKWQQTYLSQLKLSC